MAVEWGIKQTAGIGAKWEKIPIEEAETLIVEPNVVYQFNYSVPEVKWWQIFALWRGFNAGKFADSFKKEVAERTGVSPEEIKTSGKYSPETRKFQLQVKYVPSTVPIEGVPIRGFFFSLGLLIVVATGCFVSGLAMLKYALGIEISPRLEEILKLVVTETGRALRWIAIPVGILGIGWIASMIPKKKVKKKGG